MTKQGGKKDDGQWQEPVEPISACNGRPGDPRHADLEEVLGYLSVADHVHVHSVDVFVMHGVEVVVEPACSVEGAVNEVEVDVVHGHVKEEVSEDGDWVEGKGSGKVWLHEDGPQCGWDGERHGVGPRCEDMAVLWQRIVALQLASKIQAFSALV